MNEITNQHCRTHVYDHCTILCAATCRCGHSNGDHDTVGTCAACGRRCGDPSASERGEGACVMCGHTLTGTLFCTAMGCLCGCHGSVTAAEWRDAALKLADEVKRLNSLATPPSATEAERLRGIADRLLGVRSRLIGEGYSQSVGIELNAISDDLRAAARAKEGE